MQQLREFAAFLKTLYELGDFPTDAEWARQSGVHAVNLSDARTGKGQLDGFNLLRLIQATARRAELPPELLALVTARLEAVGADPSQEIVRRLNDLVTLVTEGLARLEADGSRGAEQSPDEAQPDP